MWRFPDARSEKLWHRCWAFMQTLLLSSWTHRVCFLACARGRKPKAKPRFPSARLVYLQINSASWSSLLSQAIHLTVREIMNWICTQGCRPQKTCCFILSSVLEAILSPHFCLWNVYRNGGMLVLEQLQTSSPSPQEMRGCVSLKTNLSWRARWVGYISTQVLSKGCGQVKTATVRAYRYCLIPAET